MSRYHRRRAVSDLAPWKRRGFTLVELMVSIGIIGLLLAMTLPAVQSARESARRVHCENNLKQIMLTCHDYEATHGRFPVPSVHAEQWDIVIMPFLGFEKPRYVNYLYVSGAKFVPTYRCPSDPESSGQVIGSGQNYHPSTGDGMDAYNGFYSGKAGSPISARDITDGMSNTAAISERLAPFQGIADFSSPLWRHRVVRKTRGFIADADQFAEDCEFNSVPVLIIQLGSPAFNHIQTPNLNSCWNGDTTEDIAGSHAAITASSLHPGGVNLSMADGSVRFISDSIDRHVWRAIGTRNGNESIGEF